MRSLLISTVFTLAATAAIAADAPTTSLEKTPSGIYVLDQSHANIIFGVSHLGFSTYYSRFNEFDATLNFNAKDPTKSALDVTIQTDSADANNPKMEAKYDSKTFFNTEAFPVATFTSTGIEKLSENTGKITGDLTLLGVTKPVTLNVTLNRADINPYAGVPTLGFSAKGKIKRSDFGMNEYLPAVGDEVTLMIQAEFNKKPAEAN